METPSFPEAMLDKNLYAASWLTSSSTSTAYHALVSTKIKCFPTVHKKRFFLDRLLLSTLIENLKLMVRFSIVVFLGFNLRMRELSQRLIQPYFLLKIFLIFRFNKVFELDHQIHNQSLGFALFLVFEIELMKCNL